MTIERLQVEGFKSLVRLTLDLGRVNCFIGANGVGKSNVLEAIGVLGAAAAGRVDDENLLRRGVRAGLPRLFKTSFVGDRILPAILLGASGSSNTLYRVSLLNPLGKPEPAWSYKTEALNEGTRRHVARAPRSKATQKLDPTAGLAALKAVELEDGSPAGALLKTLRNYAVFTPNTPALRGMVPDPNMRRPVGLVGGGLAEAFDALKRTAPEDHLDEAMDLIDWIADINMSDSAGQLLSPLVPRTKNVLKFTDRFMVPTRNTLTAYDASEGALYVLFAAVLCLSPSTPKLFAVDNLDAGLNPRLVTRLVEKLSSWLKTTDPDRQLLFTAHNPAVLDGLDLTDDEIRLFAVERNSEGHTTVRRITLTPGLQALNKQYPLSRLWASGNLGAVPNV